jgi:class 3 adenylate cyclase/tetratricopeptide (TPR) repeat protein
MCSKRRHPFGAQNGELMWCLNCGSDNPIGKRFCGDCGAQLTNQCRNCGADNPPDKRFCGDCGVALKFEGAAVQTAPDGTPISVEQTAAVAGEDERKTITALFADLKDSTELMRELDPEEARSLIDPALSLMGEAVHRFDGYVVQSTGDGIFAIFGAPAAYEDHPQRAIYAALEIHKALKAYASKLVVQGKPPLTARVGINTGEVVVRTIQTAGRSEYAPIGHTANLAARLQAVAPAGGVAISESTRRLVEGYFELHPLGPLDLKGLAGPVEVYRIAGPSKLRTHFQVAAQRGLTKFVGRDREIGELRNALELAENSHGQVVAVVAQAGSGKSRLLHEFKRFIPTEFKLLEAFSLSYGKASAWLPIIELFRSYFGLTAAENIENRHRKIESQIAALDTGLKPTIPYLSLLLGLSEAAAEIAHVSPQIKRRRTIDAIKQIILRESLIQPVVLIFEDLHWIDSETQETLEILVDSVAHARVLLIVNYRPEYRHNWSNRSHYTQIRLDPLSKANVAEMLDALLGIGTGIGKVKQIILDRTEGNPFFIEEMIQALFYQGVLVRNGELKISRPLSQLTLPPTVMGVLASRIDALPRADKELLQTLAVIGRETRFELVQKVADQSEESLVSSLDRLARSEFIQSYLSGGGATYIFKHALTQEAAYGSLLVERRKVLHGHVAHTIEQLFRDSLEDYWAELADHYCQSHDIQKAIHYSGLAGQQAMQRCSYTDAINYVSRGIEFLKSAPDDETRVQQELSLQLTLGSSLMATRGWAVPEVSQAFGRAQELCRSLGEVPQLVPVLYGIWGFFVVRGELTKARQIGSQLLTIAEAARNPIFTVGAHYTLGVTLQWLGEFKESEQHFQELIRHYDLEQHRAIASLFGADIGIVGIGYSANGLWLLGYPERALERVDRECQMARKVGHFESLAWGLLGKSVIHQARREPERVRAASEELFAVCRAHDLIMQPALAKFLHGWALAAEGDPEHGCEEIRTGLLLSMHPDWFSWKRKVTLCLRMRTYLPVTLNAD